MWQDFLLLVARVLLGWIFLQSGYTKFFDIAAVAATYPRRGLAPWLAYLAVPVEFFGGIFLNLGSREPLYYGRSDFLRNRGIFQLARRLECCSSAAS